MQTTDNKKVIILSKIDFLNLPNINKILPIDAINDIYNFKTIIKSPYSYSFYDDDDLSWGYKKEGILRVSNHWNFITKYSDKVHSPTDISIDDNNMYLGKFKNDKYKILKSYPNNYYKSYREFSISYPESLQHLNENKEKAIQFQKDVNNGLIYGEFVKNCDNQIVCGKIKKSDKKVIIFDNGFEIYTYGDLKTKGVLNLYKNNEIIKTVVI